MSARKLTLLSLSLLLFCAIWVVAQSMPAGGTPPAGTPGTAGQTQTPGTATPPASTATPPASTATPQGDRKSTRLNSSHQIISYAVFCLKKKKPPRRPTAGSLDNTDVQSPCPNLNDSPAA